MNASTAKRSSCSRALSFLSRILKWIPVFFICSIIVWSYYAYVVHLCILTVNDVTTRVFFLILYHPSFFLFLWAYWRTILTDAGSVPDFYKLTPREIESVENSNNPKALLEQLVIQKDIPVSMRSINGEIRYCGDCSSIKPDRCHHCSVCGSCVLKMDHHCPWVNNCVAFNNYKFFILFLWYALVYCLYIAATSFKYFLLFWSNGSAAHGKFHVLFLFFVSAMFSVSLFSLFGYHVYLISRNLTTLEAFRAPVFRSGRSDRSGFHLGYYNNFQAVFGDSKILWMLPIFSSFGDGLSFPRRGLDVFDEEEGDSGLPEEQIPMMSAQDKWDDFDNGGFRSDINFLSSSSSNSSLTEKVYAVIQPSQSVSVNL